MSVHTYRRIFVFVLACLQGVITCPNNWISFNNSCYSFVSSKLTWFHASKACRDQNARLVRIGSKAEDDFLRTTIKRLHSHEDPETISYWTDGNDLDVEGHWVWGYPGEETLTYTDWFPGEPNNVWFDKREEDCITLWGHASFDYHWNDQPCDIQDFYICESEGETEVVG